MARCDRLRLVGTPGTNKVMNAELVRLAQRAIKQRPTARKEGTGTLVYPFDRALAWLAVHYHRTATRALWSLYESQADRLEPLYEEIARDVADDPRRWYGDDPRISVRARNVSEFAAGERQIVGTVKNALIDGARARGVELTVDARDPALHIDVRMHDQTVIVSLDLAGASLSQRGYRTARGEAPLREHLAAVLLMLARYDARHSLLVDPMCGAGTICIEAALMAGARPLWAGGRAPACAQSGDLSDLADTVPTTESLFADTRPVIVGNDIEASAIGAARANAVAAGLGGGEVTWLRGDFRGLSRSHIERVAASAGASGRAGGSGSGRETKSPAGLILCNPPYGHRLDDGRLEALYRDLGDWCDQFRGWHAGFLVAHRAFEGAFGHRPRVRKPLSNPPLRGYFYLYEL